MRGEDTSTSSTAIASPETPPRAWGRPVPSSAASSRGGNTPTCVGKTRSRSELTRLGRKHPHVRGEDYVPRRFHTLLPGNTPTCVGKTAPPDLARTGALKHPHVRGEDSPMGRSCIRGAETPPRAWGRQTWYRYLEDDRRNTPTCVGKTSADGLRPSATKKHPHVRGEDAKSRKTQLTREETPPRAWGRL